MCQSQATIERLFDSNKSVTEISRNEKIVTAAAVESSVVTPRNIFRVYINLVTLLQQIRISGGHCQS